MRSIDPTETFQPLGPATRPAPPAAPAPTSKPTGTPGVVQLPDGKLATNLPPPPQLAPYEWELDAAAAGSTLSSFPSYYTEAAQRLSSSLGPNASGEAPPEVRQAQAGDWVRILSGQKGIEAINEMVGGTFQVSDVNKSSDGQISIICNTWCFRAPGETYPDGSLLTEFVEPPQ